MELRRRKKNRLNQYDYRQSGRYFITICTYNRENFFWVQNPTEVDVLHPSCQALSQYGLVVEQAILDIPCHYAGITVDKYVIMPNHVHMILKIPQVCGRIISAPTKSVSTMIGQMKRYSSKKCGVPFWQKGFYDHIIRSETEYLRICEYIETNPVKWKEDIYYAVPKEELLL